MRIAAVVLTVIGAGLSDLSIIALLGLPLFFIGLVFCAATALSSANRELPARQRTVGAAVSVAGVMLLGYGCLSTGSLVAQYHLDKSRGRPFGLIFPMWVTLLIWILSPVLIAQGMRFRSQISGRFSLAWAAYWFSYFPLVLAAGIILALLGFSSGN